MARLLCLAAGALASTCCFARPAFAQSEPELSPESRVEFSPTPPGPTRSAAPGDPTEPTGPDAPPGTAEPPPRPRPQGLVLAASLGVLGFGGQFRHVAPPAYWLDAQLGYELTGWLMFFGEAELAFTDTSESQDESHTRAVPMWGFAGGLRGTFHATGRVALFAQGQVGFLTALVAHDSLTVLGFRNAESLNPQFGGGLGVEWYQVDRHLALTASLGARLAEGFSKGLAQTDTPLMWDAALGLRYAF